MTPKEIFLAATRFEKTPRLPAAVLDGYRWMLFHNGLTFEDLYEMGDEAAVELVLRTYRDFGSDIVYGNASALGTLGEALGGSPPRADGSKTAPLKELSEITGFVAKDVFDGMIAHPHYQTMARQLELLSARAGGEKLIAAFCLGPLTLATMLSGVQELMSALYEDMDTVEYALNFTTDLAIRLLEYQAAHGATALYVSDPVSSPSMISREFFERCSLPNIRKMTQALKKLGLPVILHICGDTTTRLEPLKTSGIDVFSLDAVDLRHALSAARGHYAILGNLSPVDVLQKKTAPEVSQLAEELAVLAGLEGGFILGPGCDLTPDTPLCNIQAMTDAKNRLA